MKPSLIILAAVTAAALISCNKYERETDRAIELFKKGHPESLDQIEALLINRVKKKEFSGDDLATNGDYLFSNNGDKIKIVFPVSKTIKSLGPRSQFVYDRETEIFAVTEGLKIYIKDEKRKITRLVETGEKKNRIKALALFGDLVLYYHDKKIHYYDIVTEKKNVFVKEEFPPPYDKYFGVRLRRVSNILIVVTGMAGSYFCDIVDLSTKTILIKKIMASSSRMYMNGPMLYYIAGNTGNWDLVAYNIRDKVKTPLTKFSDLIDVEMLQDGFAYENSRGLWIGPFRERRILLPFKYGLFGKINELLLLKYREKLFLVDMKDMRAESESLRGKLPEIFLLK